MDLRYISEAEQALARQDPILGQLIRRQKLAPRELQAGYFESLCRSIIGQQVSVAAAAAIYDRFKTHTGQRPEAVAGLDENATKAIGLSRQKAGYLKDLASHFVDNPAVYDHLGTLTDEEVIQELVAIKGIGVWTAQMFLIFTLDRPDIFAVDDVGLQQGIKKLYGWSELPPKKELAGITAKWQPYRTVASLHLWQSLDNTPG